MIKSVTRRNFLVTFILLELFVCVYFLCSYFALHLALTYYISVLLVLFIQCCCLCNRNKAPSTSALDLAYVGVCKSVPQWAQYSTTSGEQISGKNIIQ